MCARCEQSIRRAEDEYGYVRVPALCGWADPRPKYLSDAFAIYPTDELLADICEDRRG